MSGASLPEGSLVVVQKGDGGKLRVDLELPEDRTDLRPHGREGDRELLRDRLRSPALSKAAEYGALALGESAQAPIHGSNLILPTQVCLDEVPAPLRVHHLDALHGPPDGGDKNGERRRLRDAGQRPGRECLADAGLVGGPGEHQNSPPGRTEPFDQGGAVDEGAVGLAAEVEVEQGDARRKRRGCDKGVLAAADGVPLGPQAGGT